jgi:hypothetical protein
MFRVMVAFDAWGFLGSIRNVAEVVAIAVGGWWTYTRFIKARGNFPRASVTHRINQRQLENRRRLVRVSVTFKNIGTVLLDVGPGFVRISQVDPPGATTTAEREPTIPWPIVAETELKGHGNGKVLQIEPGESDEVDCDFLIDSDIRTIEVYSYFKNPTRTDAEMGWTLATLYDLKDEAQVERTVEGLSGRSVAEHANPTAASSQGD